jgi:preprotein translocase subunit SecG
MLAVTWVQMFLTIVFMVVCVLLIVVVLLQKGRGGGLAGAFGGVGGHSAFGAKTGDVFTWVTVGLAGMFVLIAVFGNYKFRPEPAAPPPPPPVVEPLDGGAAPLPAPDED